MSCVGPGLARPHDLLWLDPAAVPSAPHGAERPIWPHWRNAAWPVVVRRDHCSPYIPVGLRGATRSQRYAAWTLPGHILNIVTPETLARTRAWLTHPQHALPSMRALRSLADDLDRCGLPWGPTGSTGFCLATKTSLLRHDSDLDLRIRASSPLTRDEVEYLGHLADRVACRLDIQIETGSGGFALNEWRARRGQVLLKTNHGPILTADPWADPWAETHARTVEPAS